MGSAQPALGRRIAESSLHAALRVWPAESREWGEALHAELWEIESPLAALEWAIGGIMLLGKAWWSKFASAWARPLGVSGSGAAGSAGSGTRMPRTPRVVTALLLLASLAVFLLPITRQAIRVSVDVWRDTPGDVSPSGIAALKAKAAQTHDADLVGLIAMISPDFAEREGMADQAVQLDPSLTWLYAVVMPRDSWPSPLSDAWLASLRKWDPDNGSVRLLAAEPCYGTRQPTAANGWKIWDLEKDFSEGFCNAQMNAVFAATRFDDYGGKRLALYRTVAARYNLRGPEIAWAVTERTRFLEWFPLREYEFMLEKRGEALEKSGREREAVAIYSEIKQLGQQMRDPQNGVMSEVLGLSLQRSADERLSSTLLGLGDRNAAREVNLELEAVKQLQSHREWISWAAMNSWSGFALRSSGIAILLVGALFLICLATILLGSGETLRSFRGRVASWGVDCLPVIFLIAWVALFTSYRPLALLRDRFIVGQGIPNWLMLDYSLLAPHGMPPVMAGFFHTYFTPAQYWLYLIIALSALAAWIVARGTMRMLQKRATA